MSRLVDLVKTYEGFRSKPYICPAGFWTVGYGHLCKPDTPAVDEPTAALLLASDLALSTAQLMALTKYPLTANQIDALTSWVFNLGSGRYRGSTLRAVVNRGELEKAPAEFRKWVFGGGKKLPGLILRREAEVALWLS